jgi:hypothetical protein
MEALGCRELDEPLTAVDVESTAGDEAVADDREDGLGDVLRAAYTTGRNLAGHSVKCGALPCSS